MANTAAHQKTSNLPWLAILFILAALPYLNSISGPWILDDIHLIANNPLITKPGQWDKIWFLDYWSVRGTPGGVYRPLTTATFKLTYAIAGNQPFWFHLSNISLHVLATLLVWLTSRRVFATNRGAAFAGAALFALHPVHAEAVANIIGRSEVLVACFFLIAFYAHSHVKEAVSTWRSAGWAVIEYVTLLAMCLSKESGIPLLGYLVVQDVMLERRSRPHSWKKSALSWLAIGSAGATYAILRRASNVGDWVTPPGYTVQDHVLIILSAAWKNTMLLLGLSEHRAIWSVPDPQNLGMPILLFGAIVILSGIAGLYWAWSKGSRASLSFLFICISCLPLLHLKLNVIWVWERGLYVPSIGLAWLLSCGVAKYQARKAIPPWVIGIGIIGLLIGPGWRIWQWSGLYSSNLRFWAHEYRKDPQRVNNAISYSEALLKSGSTETAIAIRKKTVEEHPTAGFAYSALASAYIHAGRPGDARAVLEAAATSQLKFISPQQEHAGLHALAGLATQLKLVTLADLFEKRAKDATAQPPGAVGAR